MAEELFYVGIKNPVELRRDVLESVRDVITVLRTYENFKKIRVEKARNVIHLKQLVKELDVLINKLKKELPSTRLREKVTNKEQQRVAVSSKVADKPKRQFSEIEKLEMELADIEHKLSSI